MMMIGALLSGAAAYAALCHAAEREHAPRAPTRAGFAASARCRQPQDAAADERQEDRHEEFSCAIAVRQMITF